MRRFIIALAFVGFFAAEAEATPFRRRPGLRGRFPILFFRPVRALLGVP